MKGTTNSALITVSSFREIFLAFVAETIETIDLAVRGYSGTAQLTRFYPLNRLGPLAEAAASRVVGFACPLTPLWLELPGATGQLVAARKP